MCKRIFKHETCSSGAVPFYKISTFGRQADAFISDSVFEKYKKRYPYPNKGDILISASGTIGKIVVFNGEKAYFQDSNIVWIANPEDKVLNKFLVHVYSRTKWTSTDGGIISRLYNEDLRSIIFYLPPLPEQNRIVAVLETWDQTIEKLIKKIEIKKNIKKGLMRELLTGKKRLPGFFEKWEIIKLGNFGKLLSGGTPSKRKSEYWSGNIPWISSSDLIDDDIRHVYIHRYITEQAVTDSATGVVPKNSIIIVSRVGVGKLIVNDIDLCTSQDFQSLILNRGAGDPYFLAYKLCIELQKLILRNQGTSIKGFLKKDLECLQILTPKIEEQRVIADILTAADEELSLLKKKLEKLKDQKRYLLNNLLTGTIPTPESLSTVN